MIKRVFAIAGLLFLIAGLSLGWYLLTGARQALGLDTKLYSETAGDPCDHPQPVIELSSRTMSENDTQALRVHVSNTNQEACLINVTLNAPNFDIGSADITKSITVPPASKTAELVWIISPKRVGTFQITVQSGLDAAVIGVTVVNVLGLSASQAQIFSLVTTFFGPMLSAPWWYEQWKNRRRRRRK